MKPTILAGALALAVVRVAGAAEPPRATIRQALDGATTVLVGRVVQAKEIERRAPMHLLVSATVVPTHCIKNTDCKPRVPVEIRYAVLSNIECEAEVELVVGMQYLFVLHGKRSSDGSLLFRTCGDAPPDVAFTAAAGAEDVGTENTVFRSIWPYGSKGEMTSIAEIQRWAAAANSSRQPR